jgi:hypothetical protein
MPTKREIEVYGFDELSTKAKAKAIDKHREHAWDTNDTEAILDMFADRLSDLALPIDDIRWRLSSSQGDGVAFYGLFDLIDYLKANKLKKKFGVLLAGREPAAEEMRANIEKVGPHMYDHWNTMRVTLESQRDLTKAQEKALYDLEEHLNAHVKTVSRELEKLGYAEIDFRSSDEEMAAQMEHFEFDVDGNRID